MDSLSTWVIVFHSGLLRKQRPGNAIMLQSHLTGSSKGNVIDSFPEYAHFESGPGQGLS
jgi:hypothetical protein